MLITFCARTSLVRATPAPKLGAGTSEDAPALVCRRASYKRALAGARPPGTAEPSPVLGFRPVRRAADVNDTKRLVCYA